MLEWLSGEVYDFVMAQASSGYAPHAICLLNDPAIIFSEVVTNLGVALAYYMIPLALWRFVRTVELDFAQEFPFRAIFLMFIVFILACGTSHLTRILTLFVGGWAYWLDAAMCGITMVASIGTMLVLYLNGKTIAEAGHRMLRSM